MEERHCNILRKHRAALQKDLEPAKVASRLYSENIFSAEDKDEVVSKDTNFDKSEVLLDKLTRKGPHAFSVFYDILQELAPHLEALLRPTEVQEDAKKTTNKKGEEETPVLGDWVDAKGPFPSRPSVQPNREYLPLADAGTMYKMDANLRGIAVIINNKEFLPVSGLHKYPRKGTDIDRDALKKVFEKLHFEVKVHNNASCSDIGRILKELAEMDHSKYNAVIVAIFTHGGDEGLIYGTDGTLCIHDLTSLFSGRVTLAGKPKLFFFQACRGAKFMDAVDGNYLLKPAPVKSVPAEADFMYAFSTVPGYYSWRNCHNGSWFIQSVVDVFKEHAHNMDILHMMTRVNDKVSTLKSHVPSDPPAHDKMVIPSIVSQLTKDLFFFPEKVLQLPNEWSCSDRAVFV